MEFYSKFFQNSVDEIGVELIVISDIWIIYVEWQQKVAFVYVTKDRMQRIVIRKTLEGSP